jgi:hypothetical protein
MHTSITGLPYSFIFDRTRRERHIYTIHLNFDTAKHSVIRQSEWRFQSQREAAHALVVYVFGNRDDLSHIMGANLFWRKGTFLFLLYLLVK